MRLKTTASASMYPAFTATPFRFSWLLKMSESIRFGSRANWFWYWYQAWICQSCFFFSSTYAETDLICVTVAALAGMPCGGGSIVRIEVYRKIPKDTHRHLPTFHPISAGISNTNRLLIPV